MKTTHFACMMLIAMIAASVPASAADDKAKPLFNGKDLNNFEIRSGTATYKIEDGVIVGTTTEGSPNSFLCTKKEYCDFVLEFDVLCDKPLNSGVQIRSHVGDGTDKYKGKNGKAVPKDRVHGYQVEITNGERGVAGGIYDEARRGWLDDLSKRQGDAHKTAFKNNEWNHYKIMAQGDRIQTWINGVPCADLKDDMDKCGLIGFQVHGIKKGEGPYQVRWKNITIRELGPGKAAE